MRQCLFEVPLIRIKDTFYIKDIAMNIKDILSDRDPLDIALFKSDNYINIYKKTEKIASAIFFITDIKKDNSNTQESVLELRGVTKDMLRSVIDLLSSDVSAGNDAMVRATVRHASLLRSLLTLAASSRTLRTDLVDVLLREIDGVLYSVHVLSTRRSLENMIDPMLESPQYIQVEKRRSKNMSVESRAPRAPRSPESEVGTAVRTRKDAIIDILKEKGVVSIKDISGAIKDYGEKTIQRDLIDMIKDGVIHKEGDRRWSKYSLKKDISI
jgi:hypothetical protein